MDCLLPSACGEHWVEHAVEVGCGLEQVGDGSGPPMCVRARLRVALEVSDLDPKPRQVCLLLEGLC